MPKMLLSIDPDVGAKTVRASATLPTGVTYTVDGDIARFREFVAVLDQHLPHADRGTAQDFRAEIRRVLLKIEEAFAKGGTHNG